MIKIYKLIFKGEVVYIGQTKLTLKKRKGSGYKKNVPFYKNCAIELIEETDDISRERFWIDYYLSIGAPLLNIKLGNGFDYSLYNKNYYEKNKESISNYQKKYSKDYYKKNKDKLDNYTKEYKEKNKERISDYQKDYYKKNKDKIDNYSKEYNEKNKEALKEYRRNYYREYYRKKKLNSMKD